jgi:hypothetical protein
MASVYNVNEKMHKMHAKLYPNYLPGYEHTYIARTANEATVTVEDICASMKNRGGYDGSYEDALQTSRHFFKEMLYQLSDGFSVNLGFGYLHPNIGGTFKDENEAHDHQKHPITFRFQTRKSLRDLRDDIGIIIEGIAGHIVEYVDVASGEANVWYEPGNEFVITGHKIKVEGDDPSCGVYFVPVGIPDPAVKVARLAENSPNKLIGIVPGVGWQYCKSAPNTTAQAIRFSKPPVS